MSDAAVEFLLNNLKEVLSRHAHLITDTKNHIKALEEDLSFFQATLKDAVSIRKMDERTKDLVQRIHNVVYEVDDIIDTFVTKVIEKRNKGVFRRLWNNSIDLHSIGIEIEEVTGKVKRCRDDIGTVTWAIDDEHMHEKPELQRPVYIRKDVVGFEDETKELISRLIQETDHFDVFSIIGMLGVGKTTVACKIFNDPEIVSRFGIRIWLPISQTFTNKEIYLDILKELTIIDDVISAKENHELAGLVKTHLEISKSFLIVMDDVWSIEDWVRLSKALPIFDSKKGKVLITSRETKVGKFASKQNPISELLSLKPEESWKLLQLEALGTMECPPELEAVGRQIALKCQGLPISISIIGSILASMVSPENNKATKKAWVEVSKKVSSYLTEQDPAQRMQKLIRLSFHNLDYNLRACFLHLGIFPEDYEIPVSRLTRMWIGEGFIKENSRCSLEETAESYLQDLINKNLVKSVKVKPDGKVKTCRVHDALREFCRAEAETQNFLQEIKYSKDGLPISNIDKFRRLSIHSNCSDFIKTQLRAPRVRSFVCFSPDKHVVSKENCTNIIKAFKLIRVLNVLPLNFTKIGSDVHKLVHIRYIALSSNLSTLPPQFDRLWNIQTLIVDTTSPTLQVKANIWKMKHLMHFETNVSATLPKPTKSGKHGAKLQTLGTISVGSCTDELFDRARNLKKLGIRGKLAMLFDTETGSFGSLRKLAHLGKLKLINDAYPKSPEEGRLYSLPAYDRFPSGLTSLTLCATFLSWDHMSTLGSLEKLEVLKLKDNAFSGSIWKAVDGDFQCLQFLLIEETDLMVWKASSKAYPELKALVLRNCVKLTQIPIELADIESLHELELHSCIRAAESARKILDVKKKRHGKDLLLSIYS